MSEIHDIGVGQYTPAGATLARFHASAAMTRLISGPVGSGKTTAACWDVGPFTAMLQSPGPDGVRRAKVGMLRDTYRNLYGTTLETWFKSFPKDLGDFVGSDDRPFKHTLVFPAPYVGSDGRWTRETGTCELVVEGRALGAHSVEATCRGWELMGAYVDEFDLCPEETGPFLLARTMRGGQVGTRRSRGVIGTFNKPDVDHFLYRKCVEETAEHRENGMEYFDQPGGLLAGVPYTTNPAAEGLQFLDPDYYVTSARGNAEWYIRRMLRNEWGASLAGEPVYTGFDDRRHISPVELEPPARSILTVGLDGGGTPAAVVMGTSPTGRRTIYAEVVVLDPTDPKGRRLAHGVGPTRFGEILKATLAQRFGHCLVQIGYADPASFYGADRENGEYSWPEIVGQKTGIPFQPAPSNEVEMRLDAVKALLYRSNDFDGKPDLIINPSCRFLRRGFASDYKYEDRGRKGAGETLKPQKTATSHAHDGLQYACLGDQGRAAVVAGRAWDLQKPKAQTAWDRAADRQATGPELPWAKGRSAMAGEYASEGIGQTYKSGFNIWDS